MRCWKCSQELTDKMNRCVYCGTDLARSNTKSTEGAALRKLYDHYGAEKLFNNQAILVNGFGDLCPEEEKKKNQLRLIIDTGILRMYLTQIKNEGKRTDSFINRVIKTITDNSGLSIDVAKEWIGFFDEMIGWEYSNDRDENTDNKPLTNSNVEVSEKKIKHITILILAVIVLVVIGFVIIINQVKNEDSVAKNEPANKIQTDIKPEILSINWSTVDNNLHLSIKKNGVHGVYMISEHIGGIIDATQNVFADIITESDEEIIDVVRSGGYYIPGETYTIWITVWQDQKYIESTAEEIYIPINESTSKIQVLSYNVPDITVSVLNYFHNELYDLYYGEGYDAYKAKADSLFEKNLIADFAVSDSADILIVSPSGVKHKSNVSSFDSSQFRYTLGAAFVFNLPIEKGTYSIKLYDRTERCLVGTYYFNVI